MTDEQLDERLRDAYAQVELSTEAQERILANLLAAEEVREFEQGAVPKKGSQPAMVPIRRRGIWRFAAPASIAAVLLIGVFVGSQPRPSYSADLATEGSGVEEAAEAPEAGFAMEDAPAPEPTALPKRADENEDMDFMAEDGAEYDYDAGATFEMQHAETVELGDGRRFAIVDLYYPDEDAPAELDWQSAVVEETGDACEAALLDDATALVRFEGEDGCYLATEI